MPRATSKNQKRVNAKLAARKKAAKAIAKKKAVKAPAKKKVTKATAKKKAVVTSARKKAAPQKKAKGAGKKVIGRQRLGPKMLEEPFLDLIRRASTDLPKDVEQALRDGLEREEEGSAAARALSVILENVKQARELSTPICQDTGTNIYHISHGPNWDPKTLQAAIHKATRKATQLGYLRQNVVNSLTGANTGDNLGIFNPQLHFHYWTKKSLVVDLLLKGGGSENVSTQYSLPDTGLGAGRDLEGVRRCVVDAVLRAQGKGCAPGVIGVGIGGDRMSSAQVAKEQLLRPLDRRSEIADLAELEQRLLSELNRLEIGPMGFGGATTVLGVAVGHAHRLPASFFVSVAYMCWACRRRTLTMSEKGVVSIL